MFLIMISCGKESDDVKILSENLYLVRIDDTTEIYLKYFNKKQNNNVSKISYLSLREKDTLARFYSFQPNGMLSSKEFFLSSEYKSFFFRYKPDGSLNYNAELKGDKIHGYSVDYDSDTLSESLYWEGEKYFVKEDSEITLLSPSKVSIHKLEGSVFTIDLSNDLKEFETVGFAPDSIRLLFVSTVRDLYFRTDYSLENYEQIKDTLNLSKFNKGEKVYFLVHYYGDPIVDGQTNWHEINFLADSITF